LGNHELYICSKCTPRRFGFGDPWLIENVYGQVYNIGNDNEYFQYWDDTYIEPLVLTSKDGARAQLWDLPTIFAFE